MASKIAAIRSGVAFVGLPIFAPGTALERLLRDAFGSLTGSAFIAVQHQTKWHSWCISIGFTYVIHRKHIFPVYGKTAYSTTFSQVVNQLAEEADAATRELDRLNAQVVREWSRPSSCDAKARDHHHEK
jgi:hypothetical protein